MVLHLWSSSFSFFHHHAVLMVIPFKLFKLFKHHLTPPTRTHARTRAPSRSAGSVRAYEHGFARASSVRLAAAACLSLLARARASLLALSLYFPTPTPPHPRCDARVPGWFFAGMVMPRAFPAFLLLRARLPTVCVTFYHTTCTCYLHRTHLPHTLSFLSFLSFFVIFISYHKRSIHL